MKTNNKIPKFNNVKEEAEFWDTHSVADYMSEFKRVDMVYKPHKSLSVSRCEATSATRTNPISRLFHKPIFTEFKNKTGLATA